MRHQDQGDQAGDDSQERDEDLGEGTDERRALPGGEVLGREGSLHLGKVGRPVAKREHEAQPKDDADPIAQRVGPGDTDALPRVEGILTQGCVHHCGLQASPAADVRQADDHDRDEPGQDHEELQDLVVDRAGEAAERDIGQHKASCDDDGKPQRPAQQRLQDDPQSIEVDPGDEHSGDGECERIEEVGRCVEATAQVLGDAAHPRAVVEGHHHQTEEDHGRDSTDPVEVDGRPAVLGTVGRHAEDLNGPEVGGDKGEAGDPGGQGASGQQKVLAGGDGTPGEDADSDDQGEVDDQDAEVQDIEVQPQRVDRKHCQKHNRLLSLMGAMNLLIST